MDLNDLLQRTNYIRDLFAKSKVPLKKGEGLERSLAEADALARGDKLPGEPSTQMLAAIAHDAHVIWALAENLNTCVGAGLNVVSHLEQITTGSRDPSAA